MMTPLETFLDRGETVVWRSRPGLRPGQAFALAVAIVGAANGIEWVLAAFTNIAPDMPMVGLFLPVVVLLQLSTVPVTLLLSDRRLFVDRGFWRRRIDAIDLTRIDEIRLSDCAANIIARQAGAIRRLLPADGGTGKGGSAIDIPAYRAGGEGSGWTAELEKVLRGRSVNIIEWRYPVLPFGVGMMTAVETVALIAIVGLAAGPAVAITFLGTAGTGAAFLVAPAMILGTAVVGAFFWPGVALHRYATLLLARAFVSAETARLYVCASSSPAWRSQEENTVSPSRRAMTARLARFAAALYGQPIDCSAQPGPEAFGGGWQR